MANVSQSLGDSDDVRDGIYLGFIKAALRSAFVKSSMDEHCIIHKLPKAKLTVTKNFVKGALVLIPFSNNAALVDKKKYSPSSNALNLGIMYTSCEADGGEKDWLGLVRQHQAFPATTKKEDVVRAVSKHFWSRFGRW